MADDALAPVLIVGLVIYFIPSLVAFVRVRSNTAAILALNLFLGWSLIGWVVALVWALSSETPVYAPVAKSSERPDDLDDTRVCPFCAELIKTAAVVCRFCGASVEAEPEFVRPHASPLLAGLGFVLLAVVLVVSVAFLLIVLLTD